MLMMGMRTVEEEQEHGKYVPLQLALVLAIRRNTALPGLRRIPTRCRERYGGYC